MKVIIKYNLIKHGIADPIDSIIDTDKVVIGPKKEKLDPDLVKKLLKDGFIVEAKDQKA